jgi:protein phosphatase
LSIGIARIVKEALESKPDEFIDLTEEVTRLICKENGTIGNQNVLGRLVKLKPVGKALIVGDLHGDLESLIDILRNSSFLDRMEQGGQDTLIFLGDYGDRGQYSEEVYHTILKLKLLFPAALVLMRGNHEGPRDLAWSPHELPLELQMKFGAKWKDAYTKIRELFACLYSAVFVEDRYLMIHGGPPEAETLEDLAFAHKMHPNNRFLEDMLWSDPDEIVEEVAPSVRGAGRIFGKSVTRRVLERLNARILVRSHEACEEGFRIDHEGRVLTLFSRKGAPYYNAHAAYLEVSLNAKVDSAHELIPCIHKF